MDVPANAPESATGVAPPLPKHIVDGKLTVVAPGALEKWKRASTGAGGCTFSTANCTVFDVLESVWLPASHCAVAVLLIICGCACANAGKLAAGCKIPAASKPAYLIKDLVNVRMAKKGDDGVSRAPPPFLSSLWLGKSARLRCHRRYWSMFPQRLWCPPYKCRRPHLPNRSDLRPDLSQLR